MTEIGYDAGDRGEPEYPEQDKWVIEGRDVFITRWGDNGLETMTVEEAETVLNGHEALNKLLQAAIEQQETADARECPCRLNLKQIIADILEGK